jgi:DNA-binding HxlR family transcriptional regulator
MKKAIGKSHCPINFAMETFGDTWSLLIIRDIILYDKHTFREFLRSEEKIATNILTSRLIALEEKKLIFKKPHPQDKRKEIYQVTKKGLDLLPLLINICEWSAKYDPQSMVLHEFSNLTEVKRKKMIQTIIQKIQASY